MKFTTKKILEINVTLDSSEAVMFNQGGKHTINLKESQSDYSEKESTPIDFEPFDVIAISFQIDKSHQARFNFIHGEAQKHRDQWDEINKRESKQPS